MPDDLLGPPAVEELVACVDRELALRRKHYPRWVSSGKLTAAKAAREIELMETVRVVLVNSVGMGRDRLL